MPAKRLCLVGESGSGKSVTALSIMRLVQPPAESRAASIVFKGRDLLALSEREMQTRARRGDRADLSGADDGAEPGLHDRRSDRGDAARPRPRHARATRAAKAIELLDAVQHAGAASARATSIRTSSPAACASAR